MKSIFHILNHYGFMRRFLILCYKEFLQIIRDPSSILIAFVLPIILLFIFGYGLSLTPTKISIGIVVPNPTSLTNDLVSSFQNSPYFTPTISNHIAELENDLVINKIRGLIVLGDNFTKDFLQNHYAKIQVISDGSIPNMSNFVQNYSQALIQNWQIGYLQAHNKVVNPIFNPQIHIQFNSEIISRYSLVPGSIVIVISLIGTMLTSLVVAREWERGTMESIMATSVTPTEILMSKIIVYFLLAIISSTLCLSIAIFLFQIPFRGSLWAFYILCTAFLIPSLGQGLLISTATKNQFLASQLAIWSGFMPSVMLSGFIFQISSMPQWIQWVTYIIPARYFMPCMQSIFLAGDLWPLFIKNIIIMLIFGFILFFLSTRNTRKRIDL